jgi:HD-like signal output (HDOD) protein
LPEHFQRIINTIHEKKMLYINAERSLGEKDHTEIGGIVAKKWKLPTAIYNVIFYHHQPDKMKKLDTLVCLVHAADIFVRIQKIGSGGDPLVPQLLKPAWHHLGLVPDDISKIYAALHEEVSKADAFLEFTKTNQE